MYVALGRVEAALPPRIAAVMLAMGMRPARLLGMVGAIVPDAGQQICTCCCHSISGGRELIFDVEPNTTRRLCGEASKSVGTSDHFRSLQGDCTTVVLQTGT